MLHVDHASDPGLKSMLTYRSPNSPVVGVILGIVRPEHVCYAETGVHAVPAPATLVECGVAALLQQVLIEQGKKARKRRSS